MDELLAYTVGSARYFVHNNHLFSPAAVTDGAGAVVERYRYDAYGTRTVTNAAGTVELATSSVSQSRGFTGYIYDSETGWYHARRRPYAPTLGIFPSRDPLRYINGYNLYRAYFAVNYLDPTGTCLHECKVGEKGHFRVSSVNTTSFNQGMSPEVVDDLNAALDNIGTLQDLQSLAAAGVGAAALAQGHIAEAVSEVMAEGVQAIGGLINQVNDAPLVPSSATIGGIDDSFRQKGLKVWIQVSWKICESYSCGFLWLCSGERWKKKEENKWFQYPGNGGTPTNVDEISQNLNGWILDALGRARQ